MVKRYLMVQIVEQWRYMAVIIACDVYWNCWTTWWKSHEENYTQKFVVPISNIAACERKEISNWWTDADDEYSHSQQCSSEMNLEMNQIKWNEQKFVFVSKCHNYSLDFNRDLFTLDRFYSKKKFLALCTRFHSWNQFSTDELPTFFTTYSSNVAQHSTACNLS